MSARKSRRPGRPADPRLERTAIGLRPHIGERAEWQRAADYEGLKLQTWIRARLNEAAARRIR